MNKKHILWITQTAMFIALLVTWQHLAGPLGQFVIGSGVNFVLVSACILVGLPSAAIIGVVSPLLAFAITGRPVFPVIIPFVMAGNVALVVAVHFISVKSYENFSLHSYIRIGVAVVAGSVLKFLVLWVGVVHVALPFLIPGILPAQTTALSHMFSWPQLVTALTGSILAMIVMPNLIKALKLSL